MRRVGALPPRWYATLVTALGAILSLIDISESSIWHDEGYTLMLALMSPAQIIARTARDVHPPLYYLLLHYWVAVFGHSELAARSLSAVFLVAAVPLAYLLIRRLWSEPAGRLAALFVACGPFLIRYSQETRMYALEALLLLLATYLLVRGAVSRRWLWWAGYTVAMAAAFYTHYYAVFMVAVHWLYMAAQTRRRPRRGLALPAWWVSNSVIVLLFLPWLPTAYHQYERVQASFWIPTATVATLPATFQEYFTFFLIYNVPLWVGIIIGIATSIFVIGMMAWLYRRRPDRRLPLLLLGSYAFLGPVLVWAVSFGHRPIYVDRYFVYATIAFYCLLGIFVAELPRRWRSRAAVVVLVLFAVGIVNLHQNVNHKMRVIGAYVTSQYRPGDEIVSGELYTFFDFSYYNHTGATVHLWSQNGVNGYTESGLIYDRPGVVVEDLATLDPPSHHLWMVGKNLPNEEYYGSAVPGNWRQIGPTVQSGYVEVREYDVLPRSKPLGTVQ